MNALAAHRDDKEGKGLGHAEGMFSLVVMLNWHPESLLKA
jgi:hypothetical protein